MDASVRDNNDLFQDHLEGKHPEVANNDKFFSNPFSMLSFPSELEAFINQHSSLQVPVIVAPTTVGMELHSQ